jgi:thiamine pyrophosphate-dependent acetolactate synthase large subunit-like protein
MTTDCVLDRRQLVKALMQQRGDAAVITGLGAPTYDCFAAGDSNLNFYLWGGMGGAAMLGLGLALAQPDRRVIVVTGDGEMMMGIGSFSTIAAQMPTNLSILVLDNEMFEETGQQTGLTGVRSRIAEMALGAGIPSAFTIREESEVAELVVAVTAGTGPIVCVAKVRSGKDSVALPSCDGVLLHHRFRAAAIGASRSDYQSSTVEVS